MSGGLVDVAEVWHGGVTAAAADRVPGVHVTRLRQLVELDGNHVRIRLTPFLLILICRRRLRRRHRS